MGWPPCMADGCDNWPSVGFTGVCAECIKDPAKVSKVAHEMNSNRSRFAEQESSDHYLVCWLSREPQKCLEMALEVIRMGETDVRKAIEMARSQYWSTFNKRSL